MIQRAIPTYLLLGKRYMGDGKDPRLKLGQNVTLSPPKSFLWRGPVKLSEIGHAPTGRRVGLAIIYEQKRTISFLAYLSILQLVDL